MYPAIQANIDRIAQEAFTVWLTGSPTDQLVSKRLAEANMSDWVYDVRSTLTKLINDHHTSHKLKGY